MDNHCLTASGSQLMTLIEMLPRSKRRSVWLVSDACSSIPSLEDVGQTFLQKMQSKGIRVCDTGEAIAQLAASPSQEIQDNSTFGEGAYLTFDHHRVFYQFLTEPPSYENEEEGKEKEFLAYFSTNVRIRAAQLGRKIELEAGCSKGNKKFFSSGMEVR